MWKEDDVVSRREEVEGVVWRRENNEVERGFYSDRLSMDYVSLAQTSRSMVTRNAVTEDSQDFSWEEDDTPLAVLATNLRISDTQEYIRPFGEGP
jgi:hypothetical protein